MRNSNLAITLAGDPEACGRTLIREHLLFDMIPDDLLTQTPLAGLRTLVVAAPEYLDKEEQRVLQEFAKRGGKVLWTSVSAADRARAGAMAQDAKRLLDPAARLPESALRVDNARTDRDELHKALTKAAGAAPWSQATAPFDDRDARLSARCQKALDRAPGQL